MYHLNSAELTSLILTARMQQKRENQKYSPEQLTDPGAAERVWFYLHGSGFVQRICSTKHFCSAPSSCKLSLSSSSAKRFVRRHQLHFAGCGILSTYILSPANRWCADSTPFPLRPTASGHSPEARNLCSILIHDKPTLWTPASWVQ